MTESNQQDRIKRASRVVVLILADIIIVILSSLMAGIIRFDFELERYLNEYGDELLKAVPIFAVGLIAISIPFNLYNSLWEYASVDELLHVCFAVATLCVIQ